MKIQEVKGWEIISKTFSGSKEADYYTRWFDGLDLQAYVACGKGAGKIMACLEKDEKAKLAEAKKRETISSKKQTIKANKNAGGSFVANTLGY